MLVCSEAYAETASAAPYVVARVMIPPVGDCKGNTVEEHIAGEIFVCLRGHYHNSVVRGLPVGHYDYVPVAELKVYIVIAVTERALGAANLLCDRLG